MCCWFVARFAFFWSSSYQLRREAISEVDRSCLDSAPSPGWHMNAKVRQFALREHRSWQLRHWRPVLFTYERRFLLSTCDRTERFCRGCETHWNILVWLCFSEGLERCLLGGSPRYPGPMQRYPACCWVTGWYFLFIFLFFGPLPGHRVVQWVPSTSRGVSMVWMDYALIQVWEEIQWGSEYEEHTVMNPVLNWIMICVFTDDSDTYFFVLVFQLFIKLQSRYELINNLTTLTPLCSSRMNFQDYLPVKMINDLKLVLRIHPCRSWC